jgi:hypothetical protein
LFATFDLDLVVQQLLAVHNGQAAFFDCVALISIRFMMRFLYSF